MYFKWKLNGQGVHRVSHDHILGPRMGTEGLGAVLEELKSFLSSIDGDFESASFDEISELQVPDNVTMFLQKTGSVMGSLLGQLKESQLRQMNVDRILKQAENKQKADQEKITQLEGSLSHLNHEISNFSIYDL